MDTDGGVEWQERTREVRLRQVVRGLRRLWENWSATPAETLTVCGHIRRGRGRDAGLDINVTVRRVRPERLEYLRSEGRRVRREGGRARLRGNPEALEQLSRAHERARPRQQTGSVNMEEEEEQLQM